MDSGVRLRPRLRTVLARPPRGSAARRGPPARPRASAALCALDMGTFAGIGRRATGTARIMGRAPGAGANGRRAQARTRQVRWRQCQWRKLRSSTGRSGSPTTRRPASREILGRPPNDLELAMYAVMWSEHCSYKSSRLHLRRLPTEAPTCSSGRARTPGSSTPATASPWRCASRATTTPRRSSPTRAPPPGWAGSCVTSSPWGRGPSRSWTPCSSAPSTTPAPGGCSKAWCRASPATGTRSASPPWGASSPSPAGYARNPLVNVLCLGVMPDRPPRARRRPAAQATWRCCSAPPPDATASAG